MKILPLAPSGWHAFYFSLRLLLKSLKQFNCFKQFQVVTIWYVFGIFPEVFVFPEVPYHLQAVVWIFQWLLPWRNCICICGKSLYKSLQVRYICDWKIIIWKCFIPEFSRLECSCSQGICLHEHMTYHTGISSREWYLAFSSFPHASKWPRDCYGQWQN